MQNIKKVVSFVISLIPLNNLKIFLYNQILSYKIDFKSKIGFGNIIVCDKVLILNSYIGNFNFIKTSELILQETRVSNFNIINNFKILNAQKSSLIGSYNKIFGEKISNGMLSMQRAQFTTSHVVNVNNDLILSNDVVFGGIKSKINIGYTNNKTLISKNVYFGSSIYLKSGLEICEKVLIGSGTTVCENIKNPGLYVSNYLKKIN